MNNYSISSDSSYMEREIAMDGQDFQVVKGSAQQVSSPK